MFGLEAHRYVFGKPGAGVHKYRFLGVAIVDVVATLLVAAMVAFGVSSCANRPLWPVMGVSVFLFFLLGVIMHRIFNVKTTVDKLLFGNGG
jgi:uncharacterized membrane protein YccC